MPFRVSQASQRRQEAAILKKEEQRGRGRYHLHQRAQQGVQQKGRSSLPLRHVTATQLAFQIARYYDKYTAEIRASFERGTAL